MNTEYRHGGSPAMRLIEECGEVIQAVAKGERFGWDNHHPDMPDITNLELLVAEITDVLMAYDDLREDITIERGQDAPFHGIGVRPWGWEEK